MKKQYIAPCTLCTEINTAELICGSGLSTKSARAIDGATGLSKDRNDNYDEDLW